MDVISILETNSEYFSQNVLWINALRQIGWLLANGLKNICDACENLFNDMYSLLDFTQYPALQDFFNTFRPVIGAVLILSILALGIMMTMGHSKGMKVFQNLVIFVAVISALPILIQNLNNVVINGKEAIYSGITTMSNQIMKSDVYDVAYMINNGFNGNQFKIEGNNISESKISTINIVEVMEPGGTVSDTYKELITTKLESMNDDGTWETKKIKDKWFSVFDTPYYFRYHVDFPMLYIGLISLIIAFICTSYKVVRIIFEIITSYLLATVFSAEVSGGQKIVKILDNLKNLYIALLMVVVMIRIYVLANSFISAADFGNVTKTFALLFFTLCLIDGPNIIEKLLGIDIGLSSAWGKVMAGAAIARGLGRTATGTARTARNIAVGNPYAINSKGGIVGRMKTAFGNVSSNHVPQGNSKMSSMAQGNSGFNSGMGGNPNTGGYSGMGGNSNTSGYSGMSGNPNAGGYSGMGGNSNASGYSGMGGDSNTGDHLGLSGSSVTESSGKGNYAGSYGDNSKDINDQKDFQNKTDEDTKDNSALGNDIDKENHNQSGDSGVVMTGNKNEAASNRNESSENRMTDNTQSDGQNSSKEALNNGTGSGVLKNRPHWNNGYKNDVQKTLSNPEGTLSSNIPSDEIRIPYEEGIINGGGVTGKTENISSGPEPAVEIGSGNDLSGTPDDIGNISDLSGTEFGNIGGLSEPETETGDVYGHPSESEAGAENISAASEPSIETGNISNTQGSAANIGPIPNISGAQDETGNILNRTTPYTEVQKRSNDTVSEVENIKKTSEATKISGEKVFNKNEMLNHTKEEMDIKKPLVNPEGKRMTPKKRKNIHKEK